MTFVSYAQNFEDVLLWRALSDVGQGRYLDVGAQDPVVDSVSLAFYEAGWRGIHVEPTPFYANRLRDARPDEIVIEAAVTDAPGPLEFYEIPDTGLSTGSAEVASCQAGAGFAARKILVPCVGLDRLLEAADSDLHWLKIDVEGMEANVLRSWGRSERRPWVLVIESTFPGTQEPTELLWLDHVLSRGYQLVFFDGLSRFFLHESHQDLARRFDAPANIFDAFAISVSHFAAREVTGSLNAELAKARAAAAQGTAQLIEQLENERETAAQTTAYLADQVEHFRNIAAAAGEECDGIRAALEGALATRDEATAERDLARERESATQACLLAVEAAHAAALDAQWRERHMAEEELRRAARDSEQTLRNDLQQAQAAANQVRVELSRLQERSAQQQELRRAAQDSEQTLRNDLQQAQAAANRVRVELSRLQERSAQQQELLRRADVAAAASTAQLALARQEAVDLYRQLAAQQDSVAEARSLVAGMVAKRESRWQHLKGALGLARSGQELQALANWVGSTDIAPRATSSFIPEKISYAGTAMLGSPAKKSGNPYLRASSLHELLSWHDIDFVRCAYVTVLGRQPDPEGEAYYTGRIRCGYSKMEVLRQLRRSDEARNHDPGIAGFDRALRRDAWSRTPFIGPIVRAVTGHLPEEPQNDFARALLDSNSQLHARIDQVELRLKELDFTLAALTAAISRQSAAAELPVAENRPRQVRVPPVLEAAGRIRTEWLAA